MLDRAPSRSGDDGQRDRHRLPTRRLRVIETPPQPQILFPKATIVALRITVSNWLSG